MSKDSEALEDLRAASSPGVLHTVVHYLYFPAKGAAEEAAATLRGLGFTTTERSGADGTNWLVLAQHRIELSEETIGAARQVMERLTGPGFGEYDGWEAEIEP